jgi:nucleoside-diphosphate-sugar epimerase
VKVFLTGGTGLVGSHVAEHLARAGHEVRALVRPGTDAAFLGSLDAELREGDITEPGSLAGALRGCDAVVHAAAAITARAPWELFRRVNVRGTESVLAAAVDQGVPRAVHVSSVAVYGGDEIVLRGGVDEDASMSRPLPPGELYGRSKREAEEVALRFQREARLEVTLVRPDVIYGERDRVVIPIFARYLSAPVVPTVGGGHKELPLV